jgi:hypothetical protein
MWGLKSGLANLIAQTGVVGLGLLGYWLWRGFARPIFLHLRPGSWEGTFIAGLYGAAALMAVTFFFSCELYPCLALMLVFKIYADAIALACVPPPQAEGEDAEPEAEAAPASVSSHLEPTITP